MPRDEALLAGFNELWHSRLIAYRRQARPPWWAPGLRLTAEIHAEYERFLPIRAYHVGLYGILTAWLEARGLPGLRPPDGGYPSIAAWWADLPDELAGRVTVDAADALVLACHIAAPARFGTKAGRYPEQRPWVAQIGEPVQVLDIGCGTGQGTWELATWLPTGSTVTGITLEPLEVWMAGQRSTPHLTGPDWRYPAITPGCTTRFSVGDLLALPEQGRADLIVCNGLIGGPACHTAAALERAWQVLRERLRPGGRLILGDTFHAGHAAAVARFHARVQRDVALADRAGRSSLYLC